MNGVPLLVVAKNLGHSDNLSKPRQSPNGARTYSVTPERPAPRDAASWDGKAVSERRWLVRERIPMGAVSLLGGDGGTGKTSIALQLAVATALEADWFGKGVEAPGPVIFVSGEEDAGHDVHGMSTVFIGGIKQA